MLTKRLLRVKKMFFMEKGGQVLYSDEAETGFLIKKLKRAPKKERGELIKKLISLFKPILQKK